MSELKIKATPGASEPGIFEWNRESYDRCESQNWSKLRGWDAYDRDFCPAEALHAEKFTEATDAMIFGTQLQQLAQLAHSTFQDYLD